MVGNRQWLWPCHHWDHCPPLPQPQPRRRRHPLLLPSTIALPSFFLLSFPLLVAFCLGTKSNGVLYWGVSLQGLGNNSSDYNKLEVTLKEHYGVPTVVAKVSRLDWLRNAAGLADPNYWSGTLRPRPVLDWYFICSFFSFMLFWQFNLKTHERTLQLVYGCRYLKRVDDAVREAKELAPGLFISLPALWICASFFFFVFVTISLLLLLFFVKTYCWCIRLPYRNYSSLKHSQCNAPSKNWSVSSIESLHQGHNFVLTMAISEFLENLILGGTLSLVGHSAGGWLARVYLEEFGLSHISLLLTLGTPHL